MILTPALCWPSSKLVVFLLGIPRSVGKNKEELQFSDGLRFFFFTVFHTLPPNVNKEILLQFLKLYLQSFILNL